MTDLRKRSAEAAAGKMSRRDFIRYSVALGVTAAVAEGTFASIAQAQSAPKRGGSAKLGIGRGSTTDSLDPGTYPDTFTMSAFGGALSNSLTEVDANGNLVGDIAESFEPSDGAKTWRFKLRKGITFHNGKPLTTTDVIESFRYHMGENSKSAAKSFLKPVKDIKADGDDAVVFTLEGGSADFPFIVSDYHLVMMPAKEGGGVDWESGIRTGAFMLETFEPGVRAKLKRNPNYHKAGLPYFDEVEFLSILDTTARMNALMTGQVDYITRADLKTLHLLERAPNIAITELTGYVHYLFPMNVTVAPFDNPDVRMALKLAIDRDDIVKKIFLGHATAGNDTPIAPTMKYFADPQPRHAYDPEKAKFHLQKAGLANLKVDLSVADAAFGGAVDAAVLYKEHAAKAGIDINVVREPGDGYWDNVWLKKPFCAAAWTGRPTADWMFTIGYAPDAAWNETKWTNPRFTELLGQARSETDDAKRAAMYAEMQQLVHDDGGAIVLAFNNLVNAHSTKLAHGEKIGANADVDGLRLAERWWIA